MRRKNIKLILLAVVTSIAMAGCGTDDGKGTSEDDSRRLTAEIEAEKDVESKSDDKKNDKTETSGDEIKESEEKDSGETDSSTSDRTSEKTDDGQENTSGESNTSGIISASSGDGNNSGNSNNNGSSNGNTGNVNGSTNNSSNGTGNTGNSTGNSSNSTGNTGNSTGNSSNGTGNTGTGNNGSSTGNSSNNTGNGNNTPSSGNNSSGGSNQGNEKPDVNVEKEPEVSVSVGNANSQISEQNKDIVNNNKTEYTDTSNNSSSKKIYVSENSVNYGYALAYVNGDTSRLDGTQKQIFTVVKPLIDNVIANYDTDHEREKAVHDYIVTNCRYNIEDCMNNPMAMDDYNFHPEGVFLRKKAVCQGYAESFKLCMDLLGIKCDIVTGEGNGQAHAWNAVCLDNEWYQIDCTWDDPLVDVNGQQQDSGSIFYNYFNITDSQMKKDHTYTYGNSCNGTRYGYDYFAAKEYGTIYSTVSDFSNYVNSQLAAKKNSITAYVRCEGNVTIKSYMEENQVDLYLYPTERGFSIKYQANSVSDTIYVIVLTITEN